MRSKRRFVELVSVIAAALLVTVMANLVGASSGNGSAPVTVQNTPLPVTIGNDALTIGGTVNAAQSGTWSVGLTGTPSVQIVPLEPYQRQQDYGFSVGDIFAAGTISIPSGKRLVIESVSVLARVPAGQSVIFSLVPDLGVVHARHFITAVAQGSFFGQDVFAATEDLRLYATDEITFIAERSGSVGLGGLTFSISGYLVPE